jgi:hypothetical protein
MKKAGKKILLNDFLVAKEIEIIHPITKEVVLRVSKIKVGVDCNCVNFEGVTLKYSFK